MTSHAAMIVALAGALALGVALLPAPWPGQPDPAAAGQISRPRQPKRAAAPGQPRSPGSRQLDSGYSKPADSVLKARLTSLQYDVTQRGATETPFHNQYWDNHAAGIYVDVVSGEPLFSSADKFDSGTGWPSFTRPMVPGNIRTRTDGSMGMLRTEVRSAHADSHLGHLFSDGPAPTGLRYCMNSAALRFIPRSTMTREGYEKYLTYVP